MPNSASVAFDGPQLWREPIDLGEGREAFSDSMSLLAGRMAHDINNLLQVISGGLSLLARDLKGDVGATDRIQTLISNIEIGAELTHGVLGICRNKADIATTETVDGERYCAIGPLLVDAVGEGISVLIDISPRLWPVRMNFNRFQNALLNLAINAREAINGQGSITVSARNAPAGGDGGSDAVIVSFSDTGAGIPEDALADIFSLFFTTKPNGSGIGLANVAGFARCSQARLAVESSLGEGTTFTLAFPRAL